MDVNELKTTASLARLSLEEGELTKLSGMVDQMLDYFSIMMEIDVDHLPPTTHALQKENIVRDDNPNFSDKSPENRGTPDELLDRAPEREDRFITIPNVL